MAKPLNSPTDKELVEGLRQEAAWAFEELYRGYYHRVATYVKKNSGDEQDARDHFQDTLIALIRELRKPGFRLYENTKLSTYIYGVASKLWLMKLRKGKQLPIKNIETLEEKLPSDVSGIEEKEVFEKKHEMMAKAFKKLGEECQKILDASSFRKIPLKEVAAMLGYTDKFVRVKKYRCMNEYRKLIMNDPDFQTL